MKLPFLFLLALASSAFAHPVAQGGMEITVHPDRVEVRARVTVEQVFVEQGFSNEQPAESLDAMWPRHGDYLLKHLRVEADGTPLAGRIVRITPPLSTAPSVRLSYEIEFPCPTPPHAIAVKQDLLNEFQFAPGNMWEATFVTTLAQAGRTAQSGLLFTHKTPLTLALDWTAAPSPAGPAHIDSRRMFAEYLHHGAMHILTGYDHLLFMAALVFACTSLLDLIKVVTAFTLAHTVTLTLSVLNIFRLPEGIVEPMIAASIVFVAAQNIFWPRKSRGWGRLAIAFGFGLFHGLGFAGGLLEAMSDLPGMAVVTAITAFSIGVELGHQAIVIPLYLLLLPFRRKRDAETPQLIPIARLGSGAVCFAGMYYLVAAIQSALG